MACRVVTIPMPLETFRKLGTGRIGYVRPILSEQAQNLFPDAPPLAPGRLLWSLHGADGTPIVLIGSRAGAVDTARLHELTTLSVH